MSAQARPHRAAHEAGFSSHTIKRFLTEADCGECAAKRLRTASAPLRLRLIAIERSAIALSGKPREIILRIEKRRERRIHKRIIHEAAVPVKEHALFAPLTKPPRNDKRVFRVDKQRAEGVAQAFSFGSQRSAQEETFRRPLGRISPQ